MSTSTSARPAKETAKASDAGGPTAPASVSKKESDDRKAADNKKGGYGAG